MNYVVLIIALLIAPSALAQTATTHCNQFGNTINYNTTYHPRPPTAAESFMQGWQIGRELRGAFQRAAPPAAPNPLGIAITEEDRRLAAAAEYQALEYGKSNTPMPWNNRPPRLATANLCKESCDDRHTP